MTIIKFRKEIWNNPAYRNLESLEKLNEGSYLTDVIHPILRAALNGIFNSHNVYFTT